MALFCWGGGGVAARLSEFFTKKPNLVFFYLGGGARVSEFFSRRIQIYFVCVGGGGGGRGRVGGGEG